MAGRFDHIIHWLAHGSPYIIEFIGTFFLVLTVGIVSITASNNPIGPLAIGSSLMVCVFMGGHISGAHYNPAVTLGVYLSGRNKISPRNVLFYVLSQLFASLIAGFCYWSLTGDTFGPFPKENSNNGQAVCVEIAYTFLLVSVVLNTATTRGTENNSFYGLAIGFTVVVGAVCCGNISGGVFNPAVGFGPIMVNAINYGSAKLSHIWIFWLGPILGSILAAGVFRVTLHHKEYAGGENNNIINSASLDNPLLDGNQMQMNTLRDAGSIKVSTF